MLDVRQPVADIVLDHSECVPVLAKHRIDFCCNGQLSLADACAQRGADLQAVSADLEQAIATRGAIATDDARALETAALLARIVEAHHGFLRDALPTVGALARKVARVHGGREPELCELERTVEGLLQALQLHLDGQESVLFPMLGDANADRAALERDLAAMEAEHARVGELLARARDLTHDFRPPPHACNSYRALFSELGALEADVMRHVHLENHVLRPRFSHA